MISQIGESSITPRHEFALSWGVISTSSGVGILQAVS